MEHIPDDEAAAAELARVLKPGGTLAVTVPAWLPEVVCWKLSDEYHAPKVEGGHVRIYTEAELRAEAGRRRPRARRLPPGARPPHPVLVAALRRRAPAATSRTTRSPGPTTASWCGTWSTQPLVTRVAERLLQPVLGKSLVLYARKPRTAVGWNPRPIRPRLEGHARVA